MRANIGIYNWCMPARGGGEKLTLVTAEHLSRNHNVWLFIPDRSDVGALEHYFDVDLSRVKIATLNDPGLPFRALALARGRSSGADQSGSLLHHYLQLRKFKLDIFINNTYRSDLACPSPRGIYMCMFPHLSPKPEGLAGRGRGALKSLAIKGITGFAPEEAVDSYSAVAAITSYTGGWVRKLWGREPRIIYPPCDDMGPATAKQKIILHVGRFAAEREGDEHHDKRQRALLETFRGMAGAHEDGWQLHFAGTVRRDEESAQFAAALVEKARGLPVTFHFDAGFGELRDLYRKASIYWHATGYGYDAEEYPAKQEHFGITTVEAMSAGAVPVVINSGGQREVVTHESDGLLWDDLDGLAAQTSRLIHDRNLRGQLSRRAVLSSRRFGRGAFGASMDRLVESVLSDGPRE